MLGTLKTLLHTKNWLSNFGSLSDQDTITYLTMKYRNYMPCTVGDQVKITVIGKNSDSIVFLTHAVIIILVTL